MIEKAARGLGVTKVENVQFVVSGGIVNNTSIDDEEQWTLGRYVEGIGGQAVRGKKTFGLMVPESDSDEEEEVRMLCFL